MSAFMRGGDPAPDAVDATPDTVDNDRQSVDVIIEGSSFRQWATFRYTKPGEVPIVPDTTIWVGKNRIAGNINVYSKKTGYWRLEVANLDGQVDSIPNALYLNFKVATQLASASLQPVPGGIEMRFRLSDLEPGDHITVSRAATPDGPWREPQWAIAERNGLDYRYVDSAVEAGTTYHYRVTVQGTDGGIAVLYSGSATAPPRETTLFQNYPNPFNPTTTISYFLPEQARVDLIIYDVRGRVVRTLVSGIQPAGTRSETWNGRDDAGRRVGSGVYLYRLKAGKIALTRKMVLLQ
jgi:hypothetical protein